jgi:uncharacterized protein DUF4340
MMKYRNTLIILVVLAVLVGYLYYDQQQQSAAPTPTPVPSVYALKLTAADVTGLSVSTAVSRTVTHKDNGAWFMDEPIKEEADTARLDNLVTSFAQLTASRALTTTPTDLAPFGLVTGTYTLELTMKDNHKEVLRLGNKTVDASNYYAQHVGDPKVYLVSSSVQSDLQQLLDMLPEKPTPTPTSPPQPTPAVTSTTPVAGPPLPLPPIATPTP